jgi:hypothetical protein
MRPRGFDPRVADLLRLEPVEELAVAFNQTILFAASYPEKAQLVIGFGVKLREGRIEVLDDKAVRASFSRCPEINSNLSFPISGGYQGTG